MRLYLAHPRSDGIRAEEIAFENETGIDLINPFFDQPDGGNIVDNDLQMIKDSDGIVVAAEPVLMIGAFMEMAYAKMWGKPIYFIDRKGVSEHPWIKYHTDKFFRDFEELGIFLGRQKAMRSETAPCFKCARLPPRIGWIMCPKDATNCPCHPNIECSRANGWKGYERKAGEGP